jgi:putative hydrolase of the HAD superfamily
VSDPFDYKQVTVVTFDAGGTLLRPHPSVGAIYREVALKHGCEYPADMLDGRFRAAFHTVSRDDSVPDPEARERDFWRRVVLETIANPELEQPKNFDSFFVELWETFAHASRWREFDGAGAMLCELKKRGFRLGIISNWDQRLHIVLEESDLQSLFEVVVISTEARCEKPDPQIFRVAEKAFGVDPSQFLHVGDSRKHDIDGAHAAGWKALLVRHDNLPARDCEVGQLDQIVSLLDPNCY